jgi:PAS domain S-box-containing protein
MQGAPPVRAKLTSVGRYGLAVLFLGAALLFALLAQSEFSTRIWFFFIVAVVASAWFGGKGPGWLAAVLSTLAIDYFFRAAPSRWTLDREDISFLFSFALCALLASWFSSWRHQTEAALRQARNDLEARVEERTAELTRTNGTLRTEIAERKRVEEDLRRTQDYLIEGERLGHTGSWAIDVSSGLVFVSQGWYRIFGLNPRKSHLTFTEVKQLRHPEDQALMDQTLNEAIRDGQDYEVDFRIIRQVGSLTYMHSVGHPVVDDSGKVSEIRGVNIDVTEQRQAQVALEEAYAALKAEVAERQRAQEAFSQAQAHLAHMNRAMTMAQLTASIAHEVNQPLAAVVTSANACERWLDGNTPDIQKARDALGRIVKAGMMASEVIARNRALFQNSAPDRQRLDVNEVISEATELLTYEATRNGISIRTELAADLPPVMADRVQLEQVLVNLVMNGLDAVKATTDGCGEVSIRSRLENSKMILITVEDSGAGLDAALVDKVFSPFFTTKKNGLGMGLSIGRSIVESHGGRLWAAPSASRGATFQFTLPAEVGNVD